jgi:hypothetical protein
MGNSVDEFNELKSGHADFRDGKHQGKAPEDWGRHPSGRRARETSCVISQWLDHLLNDN